MEYRVWHIQSKVRVRSAVSSMSKVCRSVSPIRSRVLWYAVLQCLAYQKQRTRVCSTVSGLSEVVSGRAVRCLAYPKCAVQCLAYQK